MNYTGCCFIARTSTAGLSHRKLQSVGTSRDKRGAQDSDIRNVQYIEMVTIIIMMMMVLVIMIKIFIINMLNQQTRD
jgi:hypothetical protein